MGRSFYSPHLGRRQPLGEGLESWRGFYQSIRPTQMGLSLNIGQQNFYDYEILILWLDFVELVTDYQSSTVLSRQCMLVRGTCFSSLCPSTDMSSTAFIEPLPVIDFVSQLLNRDISSRPLSDADRVKVGFGILRSYS